MGPLLHDLAGFHHQDEVGVADGGQAVITKLVRSDRRPLSAVRTNTSLQVSTEFG